MPRYVYHCSSCDETYETIHGMNDDHDVCEICKERGSLSRVPGLIGSFKFIEKEAKPGKVVKKYIADAKEELKQERKALKTKEFE